MKIIGLKGKNGSGKSTVAAMLAKKLDEKGISNKVLAFAEPLKKIVDKLHFTHSGYTGNDWENREAKDSHRNLLEETANAIKLSLNFNPFLQQMLNLLDLYYDTASVIIISDLRFESEYSGLYNWLETNDLTIVEIKNKLTDNNPPEYDLDKISTDKFINFDSTIETQIDALITELL